MKDIVEYLINNNLTISTMESCTGGALASNITNFENSSKIFKFGAITYSNEFKIKFGVKRKTIKEYSVYSFETAKEMSRRISKYSKSTFGVGITGKLNVADDENPFEDDNAVFISLYDKRDKTYLVKKINVQKTRRKDNKNEVIESFVDMFKIKYNL